MTVPLSVELRERTAAAHAGAEGSPFLSALAAGDVTRPQLAALLTALLPVYEALERAASERADEPAVAPFLLPGLARSDRLRADLAHLDAAPPAPGPAAGAYAERVEQAGRRSAVGLLAHHYARCLGDLSGGQVVRVALERRLGLVDGAGASFFAFPGVRPGEARRTYRRLLDELVLTGGEREELVDEVLLAYRANVALAQELPPG